MTTELRRRPARPAHADPTADPVVSRRVAWHYFRGIPPALARSCGGSVKSASLGRVSCSCGLNLAWPGLAASAEVAQPGQLGREPLPDGHRVGAVHDEQEVGHADLDVTLSCGSDLVQVLVADPELHRPPDLPRITPDVRAMPVQDRRGLGH